MTTKTDDIKLPPLPAVPAADHYSSTLVVALEQAEDAIRAAVEADRQCRMPSDEELKAFAGEEQFFLFCSDEEFLDIAKTVLRRYGNGQPAASAIPVPTTKAEYIALLDLAVELGKKLNIAWEDAFRAGRGQLAASAEPIYQVFHTDGTWEDLDADSYANSEDAGREVRIVYAAPVAQEQSESVALLDALSGLVKALRERHYGRMPDEVQAAYDKAWAVVFSSPIAARAAKEQS